MNRSGTVPKWSIFTGDPGQRDSVLDCGGPLPLFHRRLSLTDLVNRTERIWPLTPVNSNLKFYQEHLLFAPMTSSNYRVRRATLDDIGQLAAIWKSMGFGVEDLSRRITEFQVAEGAEGKVLGALGLQIAERQGRVHSEGFSDFAHADQLRPLLWDRIHAVATNHGLVRLWTQEQAPFWNHCGMLTADAEALGKLPAGWRALTPPWLALKLKEDVETLVSLDKEFAMFMESEKQRTNRAFQHARILKAIATLIALAVLGMVMVGAFFIIRRNPHLLGR